MLNLRYIVECVFGGLIHYFDLTAHEVLHLPCLSVSFHLNDILRPCNLHALLVCGFCVRAT